MKKNKTNFTFNLLFLNFAVISWILTCEISQNILGYYFYFLYFSCIQEKLFHYIINCIFGEIFTFIFFFLNATQFMLDAWSFYLLIFFKFPKPIHIEDLSIISQYRYLVLFVVLCLFIIIYYCLFI